MWYQFILENLHFAINLVAALAFFSVFWLYFDAWLGRKRAKDTVRVIGFLLLSISFVVAGSHLESSILSTPIILHNIYNIALFITRFLGYVFVITSLVMDPLMKKPTHKSSVNIVIPLMSGVSIFTILPFTYPILASMAGFLYLRRSTIGLEDHLKKLSFTFFILALSEFISLGSLLQNSDNSAIYSFVAPLGPLWIIQNLILIASVAVLLKWVIGYLLKRFQTQLFMVFTSMIVVVFLATTIGFTALLLKNIEDSESSHLKTDVNVLQYSIDSRKAQTLSDAQAVAQNSEVIQAVIEANKRKLKVVATSTLLSKKQGILTIVSKDGVVLARGDDPEKTGDSFSDDSIVKKALKGDSVSTILTKDGVVAPTVSVRSAVPILNGAENVGAVIVGQDIDNAFVDGVKEATGLDVSIYADNIRSATTYVTPDGKSRWIGIKENNSMVKSTVLSAGRSYVGEVNILNVPYLAAFSPMKDVDNVTVGMLFAGREQSGLLAAAGRSIELTFLVSIVLLISSIIPTYFISRYISNQIK